MVGDGIQQNYIVFHRIDYCSVCMVLFQNNNACDDALYSLAFSHKINLR